MEKPVLGATATTEAERMDAPIQMSIIVNLAAAMQLKNHKFKKYFRSIRNYPNAFRFARVRANPKIDMPKRLYSTEHDMTHAKASSCQIKYKNYICQEPTEEKGR